jgi:fatty-acyl-CoA synthase
MVGTLHGIIPHVELLYYGISGIGAICHPINIRLTSHQTEYIINNSEDRVIFVMLL